MPQNFIARFSSNSGNSINISVVGMNGSGKSATVVKYLTRRFITEYSQSVCERYPKTDNIDGQEYHLTIQDSTDNENIDLRQLLQWSNVVMVLFSITSRRSFYRAQELVEAIHSLTSFVAQGNLTLPRGASLSRTTSSSEYDGLRIHPGSLKKSQVTSITTTQMMLISNKSDLERFRLVQTEEAEKLAREYNLQLFNSTVTEKFELVENLFHQAVRIWLNRPPHSTHSSSLQRQATSSLSRASPLRELNLAPTSSFGRSNILPKKHPTTVPDPSPTGTNPDGGIAPSTDPEPNRYTAFLQNLKLLPSNVSPPNSSTLQSQGSLESNQESANPVTVTTLPMSVSMINTGTSGAAAEPVGGQCPPLPPKRAMGGFRLFKKKQ